MLSYDYFIKINQMLAEGKRFKELIELCEYAISSAVWPPLMERQCEALCRWTMAESYFYHIGDAKKARESYMSFLKFVDKDISMITDAPTLQEVMEDMYVKACTDIGQLAISYDEYFAYIQKIKTVRPITAKQKDQMDNVEYNRNHGISWSRNIIQLAELEASSIEAGAIDRLPCGVAVYSLLLHFTETEPSIDMLRIAIKNYGGLVCRLIGESFLHCSAKKHPANPDNYRFILDQAIDLVGEYLDDMETQDIAKEEQKKLIELRNGLDKSNFYKYGFASTAPPGVRDYIPPLVLKEQIKQNLSNAGTPDLPKQGCMALLAIPILLFCGIFAIIATII